MANLEEPKKIKKHYTTYSEAKKVYKKLMGFDYTFKRSMTETVHIYEINQDKYFVGTYSELLDKTGYDYIETIPF